jgi:hypothetical protein
MKIFKNIFCALIVSALGMAAVPVEAQTHWFSAQLSGGNSGDSDGWGIGVIGVDDDTVHYYLWVTDIAEPTAGHIQMLTTPLAPFAARCSVVELPPRPSPAPSTATARWKTSAIPMGRALRASFSTTALLTSISTP